MARELGHEVSGFTLPRGLEAGTPGFMSPASALKTSWLHAVYRGKTRFQEQGELLSPTPAYQALARVLSSVLVGAHGRRRRLPDLKPAQPGNPDGPPWRDIAENGRRQLSSLLPEYLPASLAKAFPRITGMDGTKKLSQLTGAERSRFVDALKRLPLRLTGPGPIEEAVVTRGGVIVGGINPSTMASKKLRGLYFAGEIIDVDALTGGFNLQIASTGPAGAAARGITENQP